MPRRIPLDGPPQRPVKTFVAAYDGDCGTCFARFYAGEEVAYLDDVLSCPDCVDELAQSG